MVLLENCQYDRFRMLEHLYRIWQKPEFQYHSIRGLSSEDPWESNGYCIPFGMEEIPFRLLFGDAEISALEIQGEEILLRAELPSGRIFASCDMQHGVETALALRAEIATYPVQVAPLRPSLRIRQPGVRLGLWDPLHELSIQALRLSDPKEGIMVAVEDAITFSRCVQPVPENCSGMFYSFCARTQSFMFYDTFSNELLCLDPVKH